MMMVCPLIFDWGAVTAFVMRSHRPGPHQIEYHYVDFSMDRECMVIVGVGYRQLICGWRDVHCVCHGAWSKAMHMQVWSVCVFWGIGTS
jgi:hypothetical protein